jgi:hypothetical protein
MRLNEEFDKTIVMVAPFTQLGAVDNFPLGKGVLVEASWPFASKGAIR